MEKLEIFQFKNTGFEGFVQVDAIKVNGKPVAFAVPAMDAGAVCWFLFEISKDLANKERASRKTLFCDFFFEIATSCNSQDYRELQHRIFKVTSKN